MFLSSQKDLSAELGSPKRKADGAPEEEPDAKRADTGLLPLPEVRAPARLPPCTTCAS